MAATVTPSPVDQVSVVVPAHNEAALLDRCLSSLLFGTTPGAISVHVVANACTDTTAMVARNFAERTGHTVVVTETLSPGKAAAVRMGMAHSTARVQVVSDADLVWGPGVLIDLVAAVDVSEPCAGAPGVLLDPSGSSRWVQAWCRVWALAVHTPGIGGSGVYALNVSVRERLGPLPDVTNDDGWVQRSTTAADRLCTPGFVTVEAPSSLRLLLDRRARVHNGNRELASLGLPPIPSSGRQALLDHLVNRTLSPDDTLVFVLVAVGTRLLAAWRRGRGQALVWSSDAARQGRGHVSRAGKSSA